MRKTFPLLAASAILVALSSGCTNVENKLGRGMRNTFEIVRGGEMRRTMEQTAIFEGPNVGYTTGFVRGFNRTLARTGVGIYEIVTAPFPPYGPVWTDYLTPKPAFPDNYTPGLRADSMYATDTYVGFSGGEVLPIVPGSRFRMFDNY